MIDFTQGLTPSEYWKPEDMEFLRRWQERCQVGVSLNEEDKRKRTKGKS